jgi:hypothetical protein
MIQADLNNEKNKQIKISPLIVELINDAGVEITNLDLCCEFSECHNELFEELSSLYYASTFPLTCNTRSSSSFNNRLWFTSVITLDISSPPLLSLKNGNKNYVFNDTPPGVVTLPHYFTLPPDPYETIHNSLSHLYAHTYLQLVYEIILLFKTDKMNLNELAQVQLKNSLYLLIHLSNRVLYNLLYDKCILSQPQLSFPPISSSSDAETPPIFENVRTQTISNYVPLTTAEKNVSMTPSNIPSNTLFTNKIVEPRNSQIIFPFLYLNDESLSRNIAQNTHFLMDPIHASIISIGEVFT